MIETGEILQTMHMIQEENFDIRTITLGINLLDCSDPDAEKCGRRVYDKICRMAENLVSTGESLERELGIPIVNKRISVTPVSLICQADPRPIARALDRAAKEMGVNFLGGYSALMQKGATLADERLLASIPEVMATTERLCSSVNVGSTRAGINMNAVREMGEIIKKTAANTATLALLTGTSFIFSFIIARENVPNVIAQWVTGITDNKYLFLLVINVVFLLLGCVLDVSTIQYVFVPMVLPLVNLFGIDLVHFGVVICLNMMIGLSTPPFGMVLFIVTGLGKTKIAGVIREIIPMVLIMIALLLICTYVPQVIMFLPNLMG